MKRDKEPTPFCRYFVFGWCLALMVFGGSIAQAADPVSRYVRQSGNADTVIVFVHGVLGDGKTTFTSASGSYWPEMLVNDSTFDASDIFVYSYPTSYWVSLNIDELAENMRAVFSANAVTKYRKLIFLSHSMGGLITRVYLLKNRNMAEHTLFAYFFSTPTNGSQIASIANAFLDNSQIAKMKLLKPEDYLADRLRDWLGAKFEFPSYCAYERRPTYGVSLVVTMDSAASLCTRPLDPIDTDHIDIVKPESETSLSYIVFKAAFSETAVRQSDDKRDQRPSSNIASEVVETLQFPSSSGVDKPRTVLESLLVDKKPQLIFELLNKYNKQEIEATPKAGMALYQFKLDYYDFQKKESALEGHAMGKIGKLVKVRFAAGWQIYLRYFLLRMTGNSQDQIKTWGNFLNFEITWEDAERVSHELLNDSTLMADMKVAAHSFNKAVADVSEITSTLFPSLSNNGETAASTKPDNPSLISKSGESQNLPPTESNRLGRVSWSNVQSNLKEPPTELVKQETKTFVVISSSPENLTVLNDLNSLFNTTFVQSKLRPLATPNYERYLDAPRFASGELPGLTIHGEGPAADFLDRVLQHCYVIRRTKELPAGTADFYHKSNPPVFSPNDTFLWLEIGKGNPLRPRACEDVPGN